MAMLTVFENIPDVFVRTYDAEFQTWARKYRQIGSRAQIRFRKPLEPSPLSADRRRAIGVILVAEVDGPRMVVRPSNEEAAELVRRHSADLARGLN